MILVYSSIIWGKSYRELMLNIGFSLKVRFQIIILPIPLARSISGLTIFFSASFRFSFFKRAKFFCFKIRLLPFLFSSHFLFATLYLGKPNNLLINKIAMITIIHFSFSKVSFSIFIVYLVYPIYVKMKMLKTNRKTTDSQFQINLQINRFFSSVCHCEEFLQSLR